MAFMVFILDQIAAAAAAAAAAIAAAIAAEGGMTTPSPSQMAPSPGSRAPLPIAPPPPRALAAQDDAVRTVDLRLGAIRRAGETALYRAAMAALEAHVDALDDDAWILAAPAYGVDPGAP
ncbi:hypothetical protein CXG81DRAFT_23986 [Caulochytrium protostelioides]|uniref:Uncharacterized protein n=1 Tax=Caulochytrium protostelioides TaxID=1555241 RepID=A0A4P9XDW6_9FUNG|nr:hypothetical protein CXG81DRAFT_23986 [Caulochytrium protostelioides]|eukprot:RKP03331.1 hypothetical protein CXG81DRAFT_23986 [Caulochytrium protostelioides]